MYKSITKNQIRVEIERIFHSHNILYTLHTENRSESVCMCRYPYQYFYGISVFLRYTGILTVCRFAGIKFFARYRYRYDKKYLLFGFSAVYRPALIDCVPDPFSTGAYAGNNKALHHGLVHETRSLHHSESLYVYNHANTISQ